MIYNLIDKIDRRIVWKIRFFMDSKTLIGKQSSKYITHKTIPWKIMVFIEKHHIKKSIQKIGCGTSCTEIDNE
jgi:hypothetical protein